MTKFLVTLIFILTVLFSISLLVIYIQGKFYKSKIQQKEAEIIGKWHETQNKQQEILNNAKNKKDSLHTGSNTDNFNNSLDILQNISNLGC